MALPLHFAPTIQRNTARKEPRHDLRSDFASRLGSVGVEHSSPRRNGSRSGGRTREGARAGRGEGDRPLLPGDRLTTAPDARIEVVLADDTAVFVAGAAELVFSTLAGVGDEGDLNLLLLERGELLLASEGGTETRVDTPTASVYVGAGSYRLASERDSTRVVARPGNAELRTRQGGGGVEAQEQGRIEGDGRPAVGRAGEADTLEQWAAELGERRERGDRLAFEDDGELGLGGDDFGFGFLSWDGGGAAWGR